jgi:hypothetical protein
MRVVRTDNGVVIVRYQDADCLDLEAVVRVTPERGGERVRVEMRRASGGDTIMHLSAFDALALTAALTAAEVPAPPPK